jgi:hypothetical protein
MIYLFLMLLPSISFAERYFAEIDQNKKVLRVIVAEPSFIATMPGIWIETSDDQQSGRSRANREDTFDQVKGGFISKKPHASWLLDQNTLKWKSPKEHPKDGSVRVWDEAKQDWVKAKKN